MHDLFGSYWVRQFDEKLTALAAASDLSGLDELAAEFHGKRVEMDRRLDAVSDEVYRRLKAGKRI